MASIAADTNSASDIGDCDASAHFALLGYDRDHHYVYQHERKQVSGYSPVQLSHEANLLSLAPLHWWEMNFPSGGRDGFNKKMAMNWLLRTSQSQGIYDPTRIRGRGAWDDNGRQVYHFGSKLWLDGELIDVHKIESDFVYEQSRSLPLPSCEALSDEDARKIVATAKLFRWKRPGSALLLAGWVALAPVCGALPWRPHIWITGEPGCGKSTILKRFMVFLTNKASVFAQGNSTEPGIRQRLKKDGLPLIYDEAEQNTEKEVVRVQAIMSLIRQASTESAAETLKGTTTGEGLDFHIRSMFCLSAVQAHLRHQADVERFAKLVLHKKEDSSDPAGDWKQIDGALYKMERAFDGQLPPRLLRRTLDLYPITRKNIDVFAEVGASRFGSQRDGDQYGTLLAGAWSLMSSKLATRDDAEKLIDGYDWTEHLEEAETSDSEKALKAILGSHIRLNGSITLTVYELIAIASGRGAQGAPIGQEIAEKTLSRYGVKVALRPGQSSPEGILFLQNNNLELDKVLAGTPFVGGWRQMLVNGGLAVRHDRTEWINGIKGRCIRLELPSILVDEGESPIA